MSRNIEAGACHCIEPCLVCDCQHDKKDETVRLPRLNPLAVVAIASYQDELTHLEITREISGLVDCCGVIIDANRDARR